MAARVGMSPASVSMVLSGAPGPSAATRERVLEAAAELGYRPDRTASLLARRRTHLVGVQMVAGSAFHAELVEDLYEAAERQGYDVVLSAVTRTRDERRATETLVDFRCEALVLLGPVAPASQLAALGRQLPVVVIGRRVGDDADVVRSADAEGVGQAVEHLVGLGHRSIAYVDGGRGTIAADRRRLPDGHAPPRPDRPHPGPARRPHRGGRRPRRPGAPGRGGRAPDRGGGLQRPLRPGAAGRLQPGRGGGPRRDLGGGYDDGSLSRLAHVNLTTVSQDARRQAEHAVAAAVERLEGGHRDGHREIVLAPHLVVRGTTGPPPERAP